MKLLLIGLLTLTSTLAFAENFSDENLEASNISKERCSDYSSAKMRKCCRLTKKMYRNVGEIGADGSVVIGGYGQLSNNQQTYHKMNCNKAYMPGYYSEGYIQQVLDLDKDLSIEELGKRAGF